MGIRICPGTKRLTIIKYNMKYKLLLFILSLMAIDLSAQSVRNTDEFEIEKASMLYLEGFYEGDTLKVKQSLSPDLYKKGYYERGQSYLRQSMTYKEAIAYARGVKQNNRQPKDDVPKEVEILDIESHIAVTKVTAWWGVDYLLLSKQSGLWKIEQVLWQGPLENK